MNKIYNQALFPIAYFGPVEYFAALIQTKNIVFEVKEHYTRQTLRNRCLIASPNGIISLTIPVIKTGGNHTQVKDVEIGYREKWQKKHWKSIETAYNSSPYFIYYKDDLIDFFYEEHKLLYEFNLSLTERVLHLSGMTFNYSTSDKYKKDVANTYDLRNEFRIKEPPGAFHHKSYRQVFIEKYGFKANLSVLDLLFNLGPEMPEYLKNVNISRLY